MCYLSVTTQVFILLMNYNISQFSKFLDYNENFTLILFLTNKPLNIRTLYHNQVLRSNRSYNYFEFCKEISLKMCLCIQTAPTLYAGGTSLFIYVLRLFSIWCYTLTCSVYTAGVMNNNTKTKMRKNTYPYIHLYTQLQ